MADNTTLPGTGDVIADEDISGVKFQLMKLINPTVGSIARWVGQQVKNNSLPVVPASDYQAPIIPTNVLPTVTPVSATNGDLVASMDVTNYRAGSIQLLGTFNALTNVQVSNDNVSWVSLQTHLASTGALSTLNTTNVTHIFNLYGYQFLRIRITSYTSGTVNAVVVLSSIPINVSEFGVNAVLGTGGVADGVTNSIVPWLNTSGSTVIPIVPNYNYNGASWDRLRTPNVFKVVALAAGTAETTIWTPTASKKFRLMGFLLTPGAATTLTFKDNTAGTTIFAARGTTDQPIATPPMGNGILSAAANNVLTVTRGTSATLDGVVWGTEE